MKRLHPNDRRALVLEAALDAARRYGYRKMTRELIAARAEVSPALVSLYLGTMTHLRRHVMREAIKREIVAIVAEGLAERDAAALRTTGDLRAQAVAHLTR